MRWPSGVRGLGPIPRSPRGCAILGKSPPQAPTKSGFLCRWCWSPPWGCRARADLQLTAGLTRPSREQQGRPPQRGLEPGMDLRVREGATRNPSPQFLLLLLSYEDILITISLFSPSPAGQGLIQLRALFTQLFRKLSFCHTCIQDIHSLIQEIIQRLAPVLAPGDPEMTMPQGTQTQKPNHSITQNPATHEHFFKEKVSHGSWGCLQLFLL